MKSLYDFAFTMNDSIEVKTRQIKASPIIINDEGNLTIVDPDVINIDDYRKINYAEN